MTDKTHLLTPSFQGRRESAQRRVLEVDGLSTRLDGKLIIESVSISVDRGELVGVVGANGSGKTTLVRTLAGLLEGDSGDVAIDGVVFRSGVANEGASRRDMARSVAYMPQMAESHPFTAFESVLMGRYPHLGRFELEGSVDRQLAWEAMKRTATTEFVDRKLDTLSGGERQRVMLARVLVQQADLLLIDEPTASLDLRHQILMMDLVREEVSHKDAGAIVILHDLSLAARYCHRLVVLHEGRVLADGTPWEVLTSANLRKAFGVEGLVGPDPVTGKPHVLLIGNENSTGSEELIGSGRKVHLVCGAGSGRELMHQLLVAGYEVTAGVLGVGDSDREAAERLDVEYIDAPPFSRITDEQHEAHLRLIDAADHVVVCAMAVGVNNLRNLEAVGKAKSVCLIAAPLVDGVVHPIGDYTDGVSTEIRRDLVERFGEVAESELLFELARV